MEKFKPGQKVFLSPDEMASKPGFLEQKYCVSRRTSCRARKEGWLVIGYHERRLDAALAWNKSHDEEIIESARIGVFSFMKRIYRKRWDLLAPYDYEDLLHEAILRICERSGDDRVGDGRWRMNKGWDGTAYFVKHQITRHNGIVGISELEEENKGMKEEKGRW